MSDNLGLGSLHIPETDFIHIAVEEIGTDHAAGADIHRIKYRRPIWITGCKHQLSIHIVLDEFGGGIPAHGNMRKRIKPKCCEYRSRIGGVIAADQSEYLPAGVDGKIQTVVSIGRHIEHSQRSLVVTEGPGPDPELHRSLCRHIAHAVGGYLGGAIELDGTVG